MANRTTLWAALSVAMVPVASAKTTVLHPVQIQTPGRSKASVNLSQPRVFPLAGTVTIPPSALTVMPDFSQQAPALPMQREAGAVYRIDRLPFDPVNPSTQLEGPAENISAPYFVRTLK